MDIRTKVVRHLTRSIATRSIVALTVLLLSACGPTFIQLDVSQFDAPAEANPTLVAEMVMMGLARQGYRTQRQPDGMIVATHNNWTLHVTVFADGTYHIEGAHIADKFQRGPLVHRVYYKYLKKIEQQIVRQRVMATRTLPLTEQTVALKGLPNAAMARFSLIKALQEEGFIIKSDEPGRLVAEHPLDARHPGVTLALQYNEFQMTITHVSSAGYYLQRVGDEVLISQAYDKMVKHLGAEIADKSAELSRDPRFLATAGLETAAIATAVAKAGSPNGQGGNKSQCETLLNKYGQPANWKNHCTEETTPLCADAVLRHGHMPNTLAFCANVDGPCAQRVLDEGWAPNHVSSRCR